MSIRGFAEHLGVNPSAVSNWESKGRHTRLRYETQEMLDADLALASIDVRARFAASLREEQAAAGRPGQSTPTVQERAAPAAATVDVRSDTGGDVLWEGEDSIGARRLALSSAADDEMRMAYLERAVRQAIADNERLSPAVLMARMRPLRLYIDKLMAGGQHPPQRARLYTVAAQLAGVLGALALDLRAFGVAHAYAAESFDIAHAAQQPDLQAWARATQSLIAFYTGDYHDALAYARDGLRRAGASPHRLRLIINGEARALARLGDRYGVDRAVDMAFALLPEYPSGSRVSESLTLGPYCPARTAANAATAYLALGRTAEVTDHLTTAITAFDTAGLAGPQALSRLDLATAHLNARDPDPEQAATLAVEALVLTADHQFESVHQRARQFLDVAGRLGRHPQLRHVAELLDERTPVGAPGPAALPSPS